MEMRACVRARMCGYVFEDPRAEMSCGMCVGISNNMFEICVSACAGICANKRAGMGE